MSAPGSVPWASSPAGSFFFHTNDEASGEPWNRRAVWARDGSNETQHAETKDSDIQIEWKSGTRHAKKAGADAVLHSTGYYNKPTQDGLYRHFKAINDAVDLPIFVYNVPARTIVDIQVATLARIAELKHVWCMNYTIRGGGAAARLLRLS